MVHFNGLIILQNYAHCTLESEEKKNRLAKFWTGFDKRSKIKVENFFVVKKDFFLLCEKLISICSLIKVKKLEGYGCENLIEKLRNYTIRYLF